MGFLIKVHKSYRNVVAVCDENLYGTKLEDGEKQLDLTGAFFEGELVGESELKERLADLDREDSTFNIVGSESIRVAKDLELVSDSGVMEISGVPFALVLL